MRRISTTYKLTLLLALLSTVPVLVLVFNNATREINDRTTSRVANCEQLALSCALQLRARDYTAIETLISEFRGREQTRNVRLIRFDGFVVEEMGEAVEEEYSFERPPATSSDIRIPISRDGREWGTLQVVYASDVTSRQLAILGKTFGTTFMLNLFTFGMLLRRALSVIDTGKAVPKRVRNTLDTIAGGVVILDAKRRIVMANESFQKSLDQTIDDLLGKELSSFHFELEDTENAPWDLAIDQQERQSGSTIRSRSGDGEDRCFVVNATPIFDAKENLAGTMVSFEDITTLEQQKQSLIEAMNELETSKEQIHQQNVKLQELASRDALTGTFNRRSLFEKFEQLWENREKVAVNCIMLDVDHFKKLNDNYGHAVGDQVLREVSQILKDSVEEPAFVGRYGGEEFVVVLPGYTLEESTAVGEKIRHAIETELAEPYHVTSSFGVSGVDNNPSTYQLMLEQADQALYVAKDGGRNAVRCWTEEMASVDAEAPTKKPEEKNTNTGSDDLEDEQPISYPAVASLHSALAYRDADTALHSQRVAELAVTLGHGLMSVSEQYILEIAGILHDIGKIGVPDKILLKPGKLTQDEWNVMEAHARMGVEIVESSFNSQGLTDIVRFHHYRFDGANTPPGDPVGKDIPLGARIVCIVDAYDAMVSNRVYRPGRTPDEAYAELRRCAGTQFDPELVERFISLELGWRADSRYFQSDFDGRLAVAVGNLTERIMRAFDGRQPETLRITLSQLQRTAVQLEMPAIAHLCQTMIEQTVEQNTDEWEESVPILQNLLDVCMTVQRAHIRDVAARPQLTDNCPQQDYFATARSWERETVDEDA